MNLFLRTGRPKVAFNSHIYVQVARFSVWLGVNILGGFLFLPAQNPCSIPPNLRPNLSHTHTQQLFPACGGAFPAAGQAVCGCQLPSVGGQWLLTFQNGRMLFAELEFRGRTVSEAAYDSLYQAFVVLSSDLLGQLGPPDAQASTPFADLERRFPTAPETPLEQLEWRSRNRTQTLALLWMNSPGGRYLRLRYSDQPTRIGPAPR